MGTIGPIGLIVAVAIVCMMVAVYTSAKRADEVSLEQEQRLFVNAIADRGRRVVRELENVAGSTDASPQLYFGFDYSWIHRHIGLWLNTFFDHDHVFVIAPSDKLSYALLGYSSVDPSWFDPVRGDLTRIIELLRGRQRPAEDELRWPPMADPMTGLLHPLRIQRLQTFMNRPAIVAGVAIEAAHQSAAASAPLVLTVKFIDGKLLGEIAARLELSNLRVLRDETVPPTDHVYIVHTAAGDPIARFAWTPHRPGAKVIRTVLPFIGLAVVAFVLLSAFVFQHLRRTESTIAAGRDRLRHLALHDGLSGLANRSFFNERLEGAIADAHQGAASAVLAIDLDHFKSVNDTLGHHIGDALIGIVGRRLTRLVRDGDLVARIGGDEFAVITNGSPGAGALQELGQRIVAALEAPYLIMGHNVTVGASIGISVIDDGMATPADVMRRADLALYRAKNEGRNRACLYDEAMDADLSQHKLFERDLRDAIQNDQLSLAYQPIFAADGERMVGVEALARWTHPERGVVTPAEFIPVAEKSGLIAPLGEWVLRRACLDAAAWPEFMLAVNVSPLQFRRPDFVEVVERIVQEAGFDFTRLELELTESTLLGNFEAAEAVMRRLKERGMRLALDDFGTGYSSLLYLRTFPFDKLKIDRSFVRAIETAADAAAIVHAVVSLGRGLGMKVTAEGVETAEQHLFLRAAGVHSLQGYRFGKPMEAAAITARLTVQVASPPASVQRSAAG